MQDQPPNPQMVLPCLLRAQTTSIAVTVFLLACSVQVTASLTIPSRNPLRTCLESSQMKEEILLTPPLLASLRIAGLVIPSMEALACLLWAVLLVPTLPFPPTPFPPFPCPAICLINRNTRDGLDFQLKGRQIDFFQILNLIGYYNSNQIITQATQSIKSLSFLLFYRPLLFLSIQSPLDFFSTFLPPSLSPTPQQTRRTLPFYSFAPYIAQYISHIRIIQINDQHRNSSTLFLISSAMLNLSSASLSPQKCILKVRSKCGGPTSCDSDPPYPLAMTSTITLHQRVKWGGSSSWEYAIEDINDKLTAIANGCLSGQSSPMEYGAGDNLTLNFVCHKLDRDLKKGDKIWVSVFRDKADSDDWLFFQIPIEGFTVQTSGDVPDQVRIERETSYLSSRQAPILEVDRVYTKSKQVQND